MNSHPSFAFRWAAIILSLAVVLGTFSVQAQEGGFSETFDDPALPGWERSPNTEVVDGVLRIQPGNHASRSGAWGGNMTLAIFIRSIAAGDFVISYQTSASGAYHLVLGGPSIALQRESSTGIEELAVYEMISIPPGEWFQVSIVITGDAHTILINEEVSVPAISDPSPLPPGGLAFESLGDAAIEINGVELLMHGQKESVHEGEGTDEPAEPPEPSKQPPGAASGFPALPWIYTGGPNGGLGYDIRMDPRDPDIMYVTDALAGAFKSIDSGQNWVPINDGITPRTGPSADAIPVFSLTIDPNNPDTIWVGTQYGGGVFRSDNSGASWRSLSNGIQEQGLAIRGFTVEPGNSDVVYFAAEVSSWEWNGTPLPGIAFDLTMGVVYKTTDGGQHWTRIWYGDNLARYIWIHPENHDLLYVSTGIFDREAANSDPQALEPGGVGVLRSNDGGLTWDVLGVENGFLADELYIGSLFMHPQDPDILLAAAGSDAYITALNKPVGAVYRSDDGGDSWERVLGLPNASAVEICEEDSKVAYAGSVKLFYRSDDGGLTWKQTSTNQAESGEDTNPHIGVGFWGPRDVVAGFPIDMQCDPRDPMRIMVNNYGGGNFLSEDGGQTWVNASRGYSGAIMRQVVIMPGKPWQVFASARSGIFSSNDGGGTWLGMSHGVARAMEAYALAVNPQDGSHLIAVIGDAGPVPKISYDGGLTWTEAESEVGDTNFFEWGGVMKMSFSPTQTGRIIAIQGENKCGEQGLCDTGHGAIFSSDGGESWNLSSLRDGMATDLVFGPGGSAYIAVYPGEVYRSTDGGENWERIAQNITAAIPTKDADPDISGPALIALAIDPQNSAKIYAGFSRGGIMVSEDGGGTWKASSSGMSPESSIYDLAVDAAHPGAIYAATIDSGVYLSKDGGATWSDINDGLLNRAGVSLAISADGTVLYLATEGGGVFRLGTPSTDTTLVQPDVVGEQPAQWEDPEPVSGSASMLTNIVIGIGVGVIVGSAAAILVRRRRSRGR